RILIRTSPGTDVPVGLTAANTELPISATKKKRTTLMMQRRIMRTPPYERSQSMETPDSANYYGRWSTNVVDSRRAGDLFGPATTIGREGRKRNQSKMNGAQGRN